MKKLTRFLYLILLSFAPLSPAYGAEPQVAEQSQKSPYQRLGGYDSLAAVSSSVIANTVFSKLGCSYSER